jgi:hypothetical protein
MSKVFLILFATCVMPLTKSVCRFICRLHIEWRLGGRLLIRCDYQAKGYFRQ